MIRDVLWCSSSCCLVFAGLGWQDGDERKKLISLWKRWYNCWRRHRTESIESCHQLNVQRWLLYCSAALRIVLSLSSYWPVGFVGTRRSSGQPKKKPRSLADLPEDTPIIDCRNLFRMTWHRLNLHKLIKNTKSEYQRVQLSVCRRAVLTSSIMSS